MMNPNRTISVGTNSSRTLLWPKVLMIFGASFLLFFVLFFGYNLLTGFSERSSMLAEVSDQSAPIVIDPKIADELAKVLVQDTAAASVNVSDPFFDRAGLSGSVAGGTFGSSTQTANSGGSNSASTPSKIQTVTGTGGGANPGATVLPPLEATKQRYQTWLGQAAVNPDLALDPRIFAIDDLLPVGIVDGGNGGQEIMFISQAAGKTVSFPLGTLFFDGWLQEVRPEGVVFTFNDGRGTIRMHSWTRSVG